jgi:enoyl-CoA hydratase/carnithine racemase
VRCQATRSATAVGGLDAIGHGRRTSRRTYTYYDATKLLENFVFAIDIPTIAAINGPSIAHTEFALLCDIALAAETATIIDPHLPAGVAPGDGQQLTLQELIGTKRAAYHLYPGEPIGAQQALELGLVNEVLPADRLLPRAWELAQPS